MESRKVAGLYLAGEILDCDGRIGGFNFQWAWATGFLAGNSVGRRPHLAGRAILAKNQFARTLSSVDPTFRHLPNLQTT